MRYTYNILIILLCSVLLSQEDWSMTIVIDDTQNIGASDQITLGMCESCSDGFHFGEDETDIPPPPGYRTDISFFNFDWVGTSDENGNVCDNPEFYIDRRSFHEPVDLLVWEIGGSTELLNNENDDDNLQISWSMDDLASKYEVYLYIGSSSYNMRNIDNAIITEGQLKIDYDVVSGEFTPNIRVVIGGCAESDDITEYYHDQDGDGLGFGAATEFCTDKAPEGWVINDNDINDEIYCLSNTIDDCGECDGQNLCLGCSDVQACNYSELVTNDNGSCYYIEEYYDCDGNCIVDVDGDNVCDELEVLGCMDSEACNYNSDATEDDGSCEYPLDYYNCSNDCILDSDEDNICDELEILGCTNSASCLFDSLATEYDGSCCQEGDDFCIEAPGIIQNLTISIDLNSATIDWEQPCGVSGYWSYRILENINDPGLTIPHPYLIEDLDWGSPYVYYLKAINSAGTSITEINFITEDQPLPTDVVELEFTSEEARIVLNWSAAENVTSYNIIRNGEIIDTVDNQLTTYIDSDVFYAQGNYYEYFLQGVNSQGFFGNLSPPVLAQALPIPLIDTMISESNPGSIMFSWSNPDSYASVADYVFELYDSDGIIYSNYAGLTYTMSNLDFGNEVCLGIKAIHQFGESDIQWICAYPEMPYPPSVSDLSATGNEGYVSITWSVLNEPNHFINIYRDQQLIASNINSLEYPPPYINDMEDGYGLLADQSYVYQISALNANLIEGEISSPVTTHTFPLPIISDLSAQSGDGRIILNWSNLQDYAGFGYVYEVLDQGDNIIFESSESYATISDLLPNQEYCFKVRANSNGGYGISEESEQICSIPSEVFDGTEGDNNIDWGIQLSLGLHLPNGEILSDAQNMLGVASNATDDCDSNYDIPELTTDPPINWAKLHFPHQDWECALIPGTKYNNDIRSIYSDMTNEVKEWDVQVETNSWSSEGIARVSFYFYENAGDKTAYYTTDNINYIEIHNGDQIEYGLINAVIQGSFKVIVGNIIPEAPVNIVIESGYREVELSWTDGYLPGSLHYEASSYNIYRDGLEIANTTDLYFIDRGLDSSREYQYEISGVNIAGEGEKSIQINATTLDNRAPIPNAGIDLIIYDVEDDNIESSEFSLPMNAKTDEAAESSLLSLENISWDPDNYSNIGPYNPPLDELSYLWESSDNTENFDIYNLESNGYGLKLFTLEVNDGFENSEFKDSVYVKVMPVPAPAKVYVDTSYSGLYSIDIEWLESNYTGEPYIKFDINSENLTFEEGDSFEDVNGNGVYDSGLDPLPPFYGLSNLNNSEGYKNIADYYEIEVDGLVLDNVVQPCITNPEDIYIDEYCYSIIGLDPSTEYLIVVKSCNYDNGCSYSEAINVSTGSSPYGRVLYPNGSEIIGIEEGLDIELDFGPGARYIDSLELFILIDEVSVWDTTIFTSTTQNIVDNNYFIPIDNIVSSSTLNPNCKIEMKIIDEGSIDYLENVDYYDISDNAFIIADNNINQNFDNGWHLIGTPVILDSNLTIQSHINNGIGFDNNIDFWQIIDGDENAIDPISPSEQIFNSGDGYYFNLYSIVNEDFSKTLNLSGEVVTEYTIDNLNVGWNLISNPLVISMNINNLNILDGNGVAMSWEQANLEGLISPYLLEFNSANNTLFPSYNIQPYKGYWVYLYQEVDIEFKSKVQEEDDLSGVLSSTDFIINLSSRAFGQGSSSFGDLIQLGYGLGASNGFVNGFDIPDFSDGEDGWQYFNEYTSMHIEHSEESWNSEYTKLIRDIREPYGTIYNWDIVGVPQAIYDAVNNPDEEIELFWDSIINPDYIVSLEYGENFENQTNMKTSTYIKLNNTQFANMRITIEMQDYLSGCSNLEACNYFCKEKPWECTALNELPTNFEDDNTCDFSSCVGCMDTEASNYNPNATIDSVCDGGDNNGASCMDDSQICGPEGVCLEQSCEKNNSYSFKSADRKIYIEDGLENKIPIYLNNYSYIDAYGHERIDPVYGIEMELSFDPSKIDISSIYSSDLAVSNSVIEGYTILSYVTSDGIDGTFYFVAYSPSPIASGGLLFELEVDAIGEVGDVTSIVFNKSILNDEDIIGDSLNLILSEGLLELSGDIGYYSNNNIPVESAQFNLIGYSEYDNPYGFNVIDTISVFSSSSGDYDFESTLRGNYIMEALKFEEPGSDDGLSAVDASRIARSVIGLTTFDDNQELAADVDMDGQVRALDAAKLARYLIGLNDNLNDNGQHWRFLPGDDFYFNIIDTLGYIVDTTFAYDLRPLDIALTDQSIIGIRIGDVDGSWISDVQSRTLSRQVNTVEMHVDSKELLEIPIAVLGDWAIEGVELVIEYDYEALFFNNLDLSDSFLNYNIAINDSNPGRLSIIIYAGSAIKTVDDIFAEISFGILGDEMANSVINLNKALINGEDIHSGFLVFDDNKKQYVYSRQLSVSANLHPEYFDLGECYPNPFNPVAQVPFSIPIESNVNIAIYDISGRFVSTIMNKNLSPGNHIAKLDGSRLASGVYIVRMNANSTVNNESFSQSSKVLLLK